MDLGLRRKFEASNMDFSISCIKMVFKVMGEKMWVRISVRECRIGSREDKDKIWGCWDTQN